MSIARALIDSDIYEVSVGPFRFKCESITNDKIVNAGSIKLRIVAPELRKHATPEQRLDNALAEAEKEKGKKLTKKEREAVAVQVDEEIEIETTEFISKLKPQDLNELAEAKDAAVCAAVTAMSSQDGNYSPVTFVLNRNKEDADKELVWINRLPSAVRAKLYEEIDAHQRGGVEQVLARFPGSTGVADVPR